MRTFLHTRISTEVLVWLSADVLSYANASVRQHVCTSVHQYVCMSVRQRSCVSVRPCGLAFSNVCFRPCPFICLVASSFLSAKEYTNPPVCIVSPLRGSIWLRSGSLWRFSAPSRCVFTPYLCPQAAGQRSRYAHRTPARPSFGQLAGIGRPIPSGWVTDRSIPNPSCTDSCVLKDTARCPLSYSKGFRLLPETTLPLAGEGFPSEVGKPVSYLRYACRKLRLCRETNH